MTKETISWFLLIGSLKMTYATVLCAWFLNFYQTEVWIHLQCMSYPNAIKYLRPVQSQQKGLKRVNFDLPKVSKIIINFEMFKVSKMTSLKIFISSHGEARNIKFGHQINIIERVPLGTLPQAVVMSLAHNHLTNLFILNYRGAAVIKLKQ